MRESSNQSTTESTAVPDGSDAERTAGSSEVAVRMHGSSKPFKLQFERILHRIEDAVVAFEIVDDEPIIVEANHAFRDIFSPDMKRVVGLPLNELIVPAGKREEAEAFDQRTASGRSNVAFVTRRATDGPRTFLYRGIPYDESHGFAIYTDITDDRQYHADIERIEALAGELIASAEDSDTLEAAARIKRRASALSRFAGTS